VALTAESTKNLFALPPTPAGRRRRVRNLAITILVPLLVAAGVTWIVVTVVSSCGSGMASIGDECIGTTDGSFPFNPGDAAFSKAENDILAQNRQVVATAKYYVRVALLSSMTWTATSALSRSKIIHQIEGADVALRRVNEGVTGDTPSIELLLANEGLNEDHYGPVVSQMMGMTGGDHPLDAVIGLGISKGATLQGGKNLAGVLMVGSNLTGDILDNTHIPGFSRVSTSNQDDVTALAQYMATQPGLQKTMLVHAVNPPPGSDPNQADLYTSSLEQDFHDRLGQYTVAASEPFDPNDPSNSFSNIARDLCTTHNPPTTVLYAGREPDLPTFIRDLAQRPCVSDPVTVLVGTDASNVTSNADDPATHQVNADLATGHINVICPAWAAPQNWAADPRSAPAGFAGFKTRFASDFTANGDYGTALDDGYAIMTHDAVLTASKAIRLATLPPVTIPTPAQTLGEQFHILAGDTIEGASGSLSFQESNNGNPSGKPVFVLRLNPSGPPTLLHIYVTP